MLSLIAKGDTGQRLGVGFPERPHHTALLPAKKTPGQVTCLPLYRAFYFHMAENLPLVRSSF